MRFIPATGEASAARDQVWPAPPASARYRFAGELTGEDNFGADQRNRPGFGERLFRWVVGLGARQGVQPRVLTRPLTGMVDGTGRILVTDVGRGAVFVFDAAGGRLHEWRDADRGAVLAAPVGICAGAGAELLVSDADLRRVVRLDGAGEPLGSFGGDVLQRPTGVARDPASGHVFVVDSGAHDIKVFDAGGRLLETLGRRGSGPGEFNGPTHIALWGERLYVTDTLNARVQILTTAGQPLGSVGRRGLYLGNLTRPKGVTLDRDGNVYVVESYYDHLLVFDRDGRFLLPIGGSGSAIGQFYLPAGAWSDGAGRIYVADMYNGRVVVFQYLG